MAVTGISCGPEVISPERGKAPGARHGGKDHCSACWAAVSASGAGSSVGAAAGLGSAPFLPPSLVTEDPGKIQVSRQPGSVQGCLEEAIPGTQAQAGVSSGSLRRVSL